MAHTLRPGLATKRLSTIFQDLDVRGADRDCRRRFTHTGRVKRWEGVRQKSREDSRWSLPQTLRLRPTVDEFLTRRPEGHRGVRPARGRPSCISPPFDPGETTPECRHTGSHSVQGRTWSQRRRILQYCSVDDTPTTPLSRSSLPLVVESEEDRVFVVRRHGGSGCRSGEEGSTRPLFRGRPWQEILLPSTASLL